MFENVLQFPSPYPFTGLFGAILLAYILWHMLAVRPKSSAQWSLIGFYGGLFLFYTLQFLFSTNATWFAVITPFGDASILLGAAGLIRFAYHFPQHDQPREARWVTSIFMAVALAAWGYASWHAYLTLAAPQASHILKYFWLIIPMIVPCALLVFWRRTWHYACAEQPDRSWRSVMRVMLRRPTHPAARAHRHLTFAMFLAFSTTPFTVAAAFPGVFHVERRYLDYGFSLSILLFVAGIAFVYFNHALHQLTFMIKLVGVALVATFSVSGMFVIELATFMSDERAFDLDLFTHIARQAALRNNFTFMPPNIVYLISRNVTAPPDAPEYRLEYGVPGRVPGWIIERPPQQDYVRFFSV